MYTTVAPDGRVTIHSPASSAGDSVTLEALLNVRVGIAACSVSESCTNAGKCPATGVIIVMKGKNK